MDHCSSYRELKENGAVDNKNAPPGEGLESRLHDSRHATGSKTGSTDRQANRQSTARFEPLSHDRQCRKVDETAAQAYNVK